MVGTGFGVLTHVRALQAAGIEVRALIGRNAEKAASRAAMFGIPQPSTNWAEPFADPGIDIVAVATPPHTHGPIVLDAVEAGKHVMCEKPFARDLAEARQMLAAAEAAGVVHMIGTEFRFGGRAGAADPHRARGRDRHAGFWPVPVADAVAERPERRASPTGGSDAGRGRRVARRARHPRHRSDPRHHGRDRGGFRDAVDTFAARRDDRGRHVSPCSCGWPAGRTC